MNISAGHSIETGGSVSLTSGGSMTTDSGTVSIATAAGGSGGSSGAVSIATGRSAAGDSGAGIRGAGGGGSGEGGGGETIPVTEEPAAEDSAVEGTLPAGPTDPEVAVTSSGPAPAEAVPAALAAEVSAVEEPNRGAILSRAGSALAGLLLGTNDSERAADEQQSGPESMTSEPFWDGNAVADPSRQEGSPATDNLVEVAAPAEQSQIPGTPSRSDVYAKERLRSAEAGGVKENMPASENTPTAAGSAEVNSSPADSADSKVAVGKSKPAPDLDDLDEISAPITNPLYIRTAGAVESGAESPSQARAGCAHALHLARLVSHAVCML